MTHVRRPNRRPLPPEAQYQLDGATCAATGKRRYSEVEAAHVVRQMRPRDPDPDALESFACRLGCGDWHVGHRQ